MTQLLKPVRRGLGKPIGNCRDVSRETIITLYPGGSIGFRAKGRRREYRISAEACYSLAVKVAAEEQRKSIAVTNRRKGKT